MGMDVFIQRDCAPQLTLGSAFLDAMAFRRKTALFFSSHVMVDGQRREVELPPDGLPMQTTLGDGRVETVVVTRAMAEQAAVQLQPLSSHCSGCPVNHSREPFGCHGFVSYPIPASTERWLMEVASSMGVAAAVATNLLTSLGITGATVAALRARHGVFFEAQVATIAEWTSSDDQVIRLSSDALMELVFFQLPTPRAQTFARSRRKPLEAIASILLGWWSADDALTFLRDGTEPATGIVLRAAPSQVIGDSLARLALALRHGVALVSDG